MQYVPDEGTYVYFRYKELDSVMVVLNKNEEPVQLELARFTERLEGFNTATEIVSGASLKLDKTLKLPPRSVQVLELQ